MEDLKISDEEPPQPVYGGGPVPWALFSRQTGVRHGNKTVLGVSQAIDELAENKLIDREFGVKQCALGGPTRSCFLVVFSPDRRLMASTHGDHNIYVTNVKTGACVQTLKGHPRTPWCIAFHPSYSDIIASGCLGGQVRVWDLHCGSELWVTDGVIASLAFHPTERLLVIATFNELHFWDWSQPKPAVKIVTCNDREKVRYVKFDKVGHQLVTGIANLTPMQSAAADRAREVNDELAGDMLRARARESDDERRYNVLLDSYERLMERYHRDLEWPGTGARRVVDQPELIQAAVRGEAGLGPQPGPAGDGPGAEAGAGPPPPPASRLLSDIAAAAGDTGQDREAAEGRGASSLSNRLRAVSRPRYMRYSLLLDREDLDRGRYRDRRGSRGRDGPTRLRRVEGFREAGPDWSRRQELRERMLELRRLRDINREEGAAGRAREGMSSILDIQDRRSPYSPFRHSSQSEFVPVTPSSLVTEDRRDRRQVLDIVGPPERSGVASLLEPEDAASLPPEDAALPGPSSGMRIPVWTGAGARPAHSQPQSRQTFMEEFLRSENRNRSVEDINRVLSESVDWLYDRDTPGSQAAAEVQRVTLADTRDNNNLDTEAGEAAALAVASPASSPREDSNDNHESFINRSLRSLGPDTRAVLLRRRQARALAERLMRRSERSERQRLMDNIIDDELAAGGGGGGGVSRPRPPAHMCPPVAIPLLTPTQIADRMDPAAASLRSPARSPGRSPGRATADPLEFGPGSLRPSPRPQRGRRSTADGPSSGVSDRLSALQSELSSPSPVPAAASSAPLPDNPFTSRPPSSASEVEIEIGGSSTVSSPVPRPLTARGR